MLRSPIQTALNDLHVHLLEAADLYRAVAEHDHDRALSELFGELADGRSASSAA